MIYCERPRRRDPANVSPERDIYADSPQERAQTIRAALDAGITTFHADHEREAASLGASLQTLGVRDGLAVSTTDGDALDRCADNEMDAARAIDAALARKRQLLGIDFLDAFFLYDFRRQAHTPARLAGAVRALDAAVASGQIGGYGATCSGDYDALAEAIERQNFSPQNVIARYNYADQRAAARLFPACQSRKIAAYAAQTFSWIGGVPFVRFPNTWRFRNLTKNFYGLTAAQAHLRWILSKIDIDGAVISMQTQAHVTENVSASNAASLPTGIESLFQSMLEAITQTDEGWQGLLADEEWEYRQAAQAWLSQ